MRLKVVSTGRNCEQYVGKCMMSILRQRWVDYDVCMIDDASTDATGDRIERICSHTGWQFIRNTERLGACANQYRAITELGGDPDDVIVFLDADDRLAHPDVFAHLVDYYGDGTLLTYGQYRPDPPSVTCSLAGPYPAEVIQQRSFRDYARRGLGIPWNHLRTFKRSIFEQMDLADFIGPDGRFYETATDAAFMYPALELAAPHIKFIEEVLVLYTSDNPLADWRVAANQCSRDHQHVIRKKPKR